MGELVRSFKAPWDPSGGAGVVHEEQIQERIKVEVGDWM